MKHATPIELDVIYRLSDFKTLSGLGDWAMRTARGRGFRVFLAGGKKYVYGRDFLDYLRTVAEAGGDGASESDEPDVISMPDAG